LDWVPLVVSLLACAATQTASPAVCPILPIGRIRSTSTSNNLSGSSEWRGLFQTGSMRPTARSVENLDQGQESESAGSYPRHRRYVLDKFSSLNAIIYCSWHRFETFQQGRLPELSPDYLLPLPPGSQSDESTGRAAANHGPVALLLNAVN
jgi:hypothetical protein